MPNISSAKGSNCSTPSARRRRRIISKKPTPPYRGTRTKCWLKIKCIRRQEFVVIGWWRARPKGRGFRSLILAVNEDGKLRFAGKVGTGFSLQTLQELHARLQKLEIKEAPAPVPRAEARGAHWVRPELVAEVAFAEFTAERVVRHASFLGLREDKPASCVIEEKVLPRSPEEDRVKISNPERVIDPQSGVTKGELADYVRAVAPLMLPWAANRPLSLVRCPQGRAKKCFFQKHSTGTFGPDVHQIDIEEKKGEVVDYVYVKDQAGLMSCVQMGTIEFHGWGSSTGDIEKPDRLVFDIDPDEGLGFEHVRKAARDLKDHLADMGLQTFPMLTGGKGIHVIVPLTPRAEWPEVKDFAMRFCVALATAEPTASPPTSPRLGARAACSSITCATSAARPQSFLSPLARAKGRRSRPRSRGRSWMNMCPARASPCATAPFFSNAPRPAPFRGGARPTRCCQTYE
jgi:bifunctional non-homologous end joining protein LigD